MNCGKYIERSLNTIEVADSFFELLNYDIDADTDILFWKPLLLALSGYELHLKNYRGANITKNALHQICFNAYFTRSLIYTLIRIDKYLKEIIVEDADDLKAIKRHFGKLISSVQFADMDSLNKEP